MKLFICGSVHNDVGCAGCDKEFFWANNAREAALTYRVFQKSWRMQDLARVVRVWEIVPPGKPGTFRSLWDHVSGAYVDIDL